MINRVQIEITNFCNNSCIYCPHRQLSREKTFMSLDKVEYILNKCKEYGVKEVYPMLNGEPTLHKNFIDIIKLIKQYGFSCPIITNFSGLNKEQIIELNSILEPTDSLVISLDAITPDLYKSIRKGSIIPVLNNLEILKSLRHNYPVVAQVIKTSFHTERDIQDIINYFMNTDIQVGTGDVLNWGGVIDSNIKNNHNFCNRLINDLCIFIDGNIPLCCIDYDGKHIFGNIFKDDIKQIDLNRQEFIQKFPQGLCVSCNGRW